MSNATTPFENQKTETIFERHSWKVFLGLSLIIVLFGLGDIVAGGSTFETGEGPTLLGITGMTWQELQTASPQVANLVDYLVRSGGAHLLVVGLLSTFISLTAFRQGQRWAWYAMWIWPLWIVLVVPVLLNAYQQPGPGIPPPLVSGPIIFALSVLTLGLSHRKFFRKH